MSLTKIDLTGDDGENPIVGAKRELLVSESTDINTKHTKTTHSALNIAPKTPVANQSTIDLTGDGGKNPVLGAKRELLVSENTEYNAKVAKATPTAVNIVPQTPDAHQTYENEYARQYAQMYGEISSGDAKKFFFLTPEDLGSIPFRRGGWGSGQLKLYNTQEIRGMAVRKFGQDGLERRIREQASKYAKKKVKEAAAAATAKILAATPAAERAAAITPDISASLKSVQKSIIQQIKQQLGNKENGGPFRVEVPGITKAAFAAILKRPTDIELASVSKNGAFHTLNTTLETLLTPMIRSASEIRKSKFGTYFCAQSECVVKYKQAALLLRISGYGTVDFSQFGY
jgi:histone H3/H4